ncbi:MAG: MFS transporter [Chloroflexi bacterium]|nr:MFS transporter [Chloroflexota bacterium]
MAHSTGSPPPSGAEGKKEAGVSRLFLAFGSRPYRWLWANSVLASLGRMTEMLVQGWLVLLVTDSVFWVGASAGLRGVGTVGFGLIGGVIVDRMDRRKVLLVTQLLGAGVALLVALLVVTDTVKLWHLLLVAVLQGMMMAVAMPARNALTFDIVGKERLVNALALNMMALNITRSVGALIAGVMIDSVGVGRVYYMISGSLALASVVLVFMEGDYPPTGAREPVWRNAREGVVHVWNNRPVRSLLSLSLLVEGFAFSFHVMLPVMARDVLHVGGTGFGVLASVGGIGALASTAVVAYMGDFRSIGRMVVMTAGGFGLFLVLFALSPALPSSFAVALVALLLVGAMSMAYDTTMGALLQLLVPDAVRGRVMGLYVLTFGFTPLGGFVAGAIASVVGAPIAVGLGGGVVVGYVIGRVRPMSRIREAEVPVGEQG